MTESPTQDKAKEIAFFDTFGDKQEYNVFTCASNARLIDRVVALGKWEQGTTVIDLGCGSGVFSQLIKERGYVTFGLDISQGIMRIGKRDYPELAFVAGDVEHLPFADNSLPGVLLSGIVHHFSKPEKFAAEVFRVLKPGGRFVAFDPNRRNPFMRLYRDHKSPLYSSKGVTENERPVKAEKVAQVFTEAGFSVRTNYLSRLHYRYVASNAVRAMLPIYNLFDSLLAIPKFMEPYRAFVLTSGRKP